MGLAHASVRQRGEARDLRALFKNRFSSSSEMIFAPRGSCSGKAEAMAGEHPMEAMVQAVLLRATPHKSMLGYEEDIRLTIAELVRMHPPRMFLF